MVFLLKNNCFANNNIVYLDIQFIIDNSKIGIHYKEKIIKYEKKNKLILNKKEKEIKSKQVEINNQKNIIKDEELKIKINELKKIIDAYKIEVKKANKSIVQMKKDYSTNILKILNPLLSNYVEKNNINIVIDKKNVLVGIKTLDVTNDLLKILDKEVNKKKLINND
tara:strand:- start:545 stop:1045 length:501 start_codon:yes stop_codon:yes gene_type:complete